MNLATWSYARLLAVGALLAAVLAVLLAVYLNRPPAPPARQAVSALAQARSGPVRVVRRVSPVPAPRTPLWPDNGCQQGWSGTCTPQDAAGRCPPGWFPGGKHSCWRVTRCTLAAMAANYCGTAAQQAAARKGLGLT